MNKSGPSVSALWSLAERIEDGGENEEGGRRGGEAVRRGGKEKCKSSKPSRSKKITWERI